MVNDSLFFFFSVQLCVYIYTLNFEFWILFGRFWFGFGVNCCVLCIHGALHQGWRELQCSGTFEFLFFIFFYFYVQLLGTWGGNIKWASLVLAFCIVWDPGKCNPPLIRMIQAFGLVKIQTFDFILFSLFFFVWVPGKGM